MSRFSALFKAPKRPNDMASPKEAVVESRSTDSPERTLEDNVFSLVPPESSANASEAARGAADTPPGEPDQPSPKKSGRNIQPLATADLSRLSIDNDGRLYWDGKPVEVRRRISISRAQVVGASIVAPFVVIGALASAIQGVVAARELARRFGWSASACTLPGAVQPRHGSDIPA